MRKLWLNSPIRFKILSYYFVLVGLLFLALFNFNNNNTKIINQLNDTIDSSYKIYIAMEQTSQDVKDVERYLFYNDKVALNSYLDRIEIVDITIDELYQINTSLESHFRINAIYYSVKASRDLFNSAIDKKQQGDETSYEDYYEALKIREFTNQYFNELLLENSKYESLRVEKVKTDTSKIRRTSYNLIIIVSVIALVLGILISNYIVMPIKKLSDYSKKISKGDLEIRRVEIESKDEIGDLSSAYNHMGESIKNYVERIKEKANIEKKLHEEEKAVLQMEQLLQVARLEALQAKINPHFLFNTLNVIARTAFFEDALKTMELIQMLSKLFRYQLKSAGDKVSLDEERALIEDYFKLQKARFKERLNYDIDIPSNINMYIPVLILQPLVENAIIHGIGPCIKGGSIKVIAYEDKDKVIIEVNDDGVGMDENLVEQFMNKNEKSYKNKASIGISNVRDRILLSFPNRSEFIIDSKIDLGTTIKIIITREA